MGCARAIARVCACRPRQARMLCLHTGLRTRLCLCASERMTALCWVLDFRTQLTWLRALVNRQHDPLRALHVLPLDDHCTPAASLFCRTSIPREGHICHLQAALGRVRRWRVRHSRDHYRVGPDRGTAVCTRAKWRGGRQLVARAGQCRHSEQLWGDSTRAAL